MLPGLSSRLARLGRVGQRQTGLLSCYHGQRYEEKPFITLAHSEKLLLPPSASLAWGFSPLLLWACDGWRNGPLCDLCAWADDSLWALPGNRVGEA